MNSSTLTSPKMTTQKSSIPTFLNFVDQVSDCIGANVPQIVDIELLKKLPEGTFGRTVADFYQQNNLHPFITGPRRKQLHDCVHVLTNYGTDPISELEVQAFLLGAKFNPFQLVLSVGLLRIAHRQTIPFPLTRPQIRQRLQAAYQRGQSAQFDPDSWQPETLWHCSLAQVQATFHV